MLGSGFPGGGGEARDGLGVAGETFHGGSGRQARTTSHTFDTQGMSVSLGHFKAFQIPNRKIVLGDPLIPFRLKKPSLAVLTHPASHVGK